MESRFVILSLKGYLDSIAKKHFLVPSLSFSHNRYFDTISAQLFLDLQVKQMKTENPQMDGKRRLRPSLRYNVLV